MPFNTPLPEEETDTKSRSVAQRSHSASASSWTIRRVTYTLGGQTIAQRIMGTDDDGVFYVHQDHLGSASIISDSAGRVMGDTKATFYPFGSYRHQATTKLSGRGFTGHQHDDGIGLIYMNARFYVPSIGRFASADTIVPDPLNPQAFNRYSYVENRPILYTDPTGHCAENGDETCWSYAEYLCRVYCDWQQNSRGLDWWDIEYLGSLAEDELWAIGQRLNPQNWVTTPAGYRFWVGEGSDPREDGSFPRRRNGQDTPVTVDNGVLWAFSAGPFQADVGEEVLYETEYGGSGCFILCFPIVQQSGRTPREGGALYNKEATVFAIGLGDDMEGIGMKVSGGYRAYDETLTVDANDQVIREQGHELFFSVTIGVVSFESSKQVSPILGERWVPR